MLPRSWVARTKPEAAVVRSEGWSAFARARVGSGAAWSRARGTASIAW